MDTFEGINEFVAVAEKQGFSAAARYLGCSTSHVSRQLSRLEENLGCALVARTTRTINLTKAGELYYQHCVELLDGLRHANEQVSSQQYQLSGTLRVSAAGAFAEMYIVPALVDFADSHPELSLEVDFNSRMVNFVEDGFDFAVRYGGLTDSGLIARKLVSRRMMAVASEEYLARCGMPETPEQLRDHSCIITNNARWLFKHDGEPLSVKVSGRFNSNNARAVVSACEKGLGIAYMPKSSFAVLASSDKLIPVLEPYWNDDASSWIVYQNKRFLPMRARLAIDHLVEHFKDWQE